MARQYAVFPRNPSPAEATNRGMMIQERMARLEEGIAKANLVFDEYSPKVSFTPEEYMKYYDNSCVYHMCAIDYGAHMLEKFEKAMEESILSKVLPAICDKEGVPLLVQFLHMWSKYQAFSKFLGVFFLYLGREAERRKGGRLEDIATRLYCDHVCKPFLQKLFSAAVTLIVEDRNGQLIDKYLLQQISTFFVESCGRESASYYNNFEEVILANAAGFYSSVASQWLLSYSAKDYILKVDQCFNEERERAFQFLPPSSVEKLLKTMHFVLVDQTANVLNEKRRSENQDSTTLQGLLSGLSIQ
ncbi:OLC1v1000422C1 [Oldenlandia corymbosa var. corymbosa]|uniref:OLC1v1000422C1 n=1 Tax=Oldenlandia corymbosa var. corymbosa TaxID=529605 RepID=A0AAV1D6B4_OLDCO|nr:OLC1v1000422C1 [Oldenlandia corymbosa var. corymbosa]